MHAILEISSVSEVNWTTWLKRPYQSVEKQMVNHENNFFNSIYIPKPAYIVEKFS